MQRCPAILAGFVAGIALASSAPAAEAHLVRIEEAACRYLAAHTPEPDVAYRPGEDVHGRPVAPADLPGGPSLALPPDILIALPVPLESFLDAPAHPGIAAEAYAGTVIFEPATGAIFYEGQPLRGEAYEAVAAACRERAPRR